MRILLDECSPRAVKKLLPQCEIFTVQEMGWAGVKNGKLLNLAESQFDVFITTDKNLRYQQNLSGRKLAIIQLPTNEVPVVVALITDIVAVLNQIQPGDFVEIPFPAS